MRYCAPSLGAGACSPGTIGGGVLRVGTGVTAGDAAAVGAMLPGAGGIMILDTIWVGACPDRWPTPNAAAVITNSSAATIQRQGAFPGRNLALKPESWSNGSAKFR